MRLLGAWALLVLTAASVQAQGMQEAPVCMAERHGNSLITRIDYPDGYSVEAPWRVTGDTRSGRATTITAVLQHIVETRPFTSTRRMTSLPSAIEMTFRGSSLTEMLNEAANVWCLTVMKARPPHGQPDTDDGAVRSHIAM